MSAGRSVPRCLNRAIPARKGPLSDFVNRLELRHGYGMTPFQQFCHVLADVVLMIHAAFIVFVVGGLVLIWVGGFRGWAFVRNLWFRAAHLAAIGVVVAESLSGVVCPLTVWEDKLRLLAGDQARSAGSSFIQDWVHRLIFFDLNERTFTIIYLGFFLAVALSLWLIPPRWPRRPAPGATPSS
ncbi:MAG TPA: DUF2784 domain-containing protein [Candidatus Binatia bacterium]|nr:DUF2784 domain-containing protein [Candidatus Binatia bacterium]